MVDQPTFSEHLPAPEFTDSDLGLAMDSPGPSVAFYSFCFYANGQKTVVRGNIKQFHEATVIRCTLRRGIASP